MATTNRVRRTAINGTRNKLPTLQDKDENFVYRYVYDNSTDFRVEELQERGYEVVDRKTIKTIADRRVADPSQMGSTLTVPSGQNKLVLMRIPKEYAKEDQALKNKQVDDLEASMQRPSNELTGKVEITR